MSVKLIKSNSIEFYHRGGPPGHAEVGRAVSTDISSTMGAGIARFDQCSIAWTVLYDEVVYVVEGCFRLVTADETFAAEAGDILWIPEGTELKYEGDSATIFYAVYPGNWKEMLQG
ncbi:cupin domain-containing protein [Neptuniibacter halophilus]|uniref:cupin domain-containing protein n=1 Tax=Neptuniibacter halophilus TaxID=651666 RepID=UPI0025742FCF|nr:cupin domain-containing protein [Neptuniibacter halophilus]